MSSDVQRETAVLRQGDGSMSAAKMPESGCLHFHIGETCVNVCGGRLVVLHREPDRVRWCFRCRAHLPHDFVLWGDRGPSYYSPNPGYWCSGCGEDHTLGFGMEREWVDV